MWIIYDTVIQCRFYCGYYFCILYVFLHITQKWLHLFYSLALIGTIDESTWCCRFWYAKVHGKSIQWKFGSWLLNTFGVCFVAIWSWIGYIGCYCNNNFNTVLELRLWCLYYYLFVHLFHLVENFHFEFSCFIIYNQRCQVIFVFVKTLRKTTHCWRNVGSFRIESRLFEINQ